MATAAALLLVAAAGSAAAQEVDRASDDPDRVVRLREREPATVAPIGTTIRGSVIRRPRYADEGFDPSVIPDLDGDDPRRSELARQGEAAEAPAVSLSWEGLTRVAAGHDSNVFRAERDRTEDGFWRVQGEVELLAKLPTGGELFAEVSGETQQYFSRHEANEHYVAAFVEYFHPVSVWLDVGLQNAFELSRLNLLDDNGDLFPRGRFGSIDEEVRGFVILRPPPSGAAGDDGIRLRDFALELGASYRLKDYEENSGVDSLDYRELRLDASISLKLSRRPRARLKLKYRFRRRDYREFRARTRDGAVATAPPRLALQRHQLNLTWFQEVRLASFEGRLIAGAGAVYNRDLVENDRSYREVSLSARVEWWLRPRETRLDLGVRGVGRDFLVRRPASAGGLLRHRLLSVSVGVWQQILGVAQASGRADALTLAVFCSFAQTVWRSRDAGEDYDRLVGQGGLEVAW